MGVKTGFKMRSLGAAAAVLMLAGCAANGGMNGQASALPPPPAEIKPFDGAAHQAALRDPALLKAEELDSKHDDQAAAAAYRAAAEAGNPIARYMLALMYVDGDGVTHDAAEAARQFHEAAMAGYAPAQARLGDNYEKGNGVAKDQAMANRWYVFAAAQGEDISCGRLGMSMLQGENMPRDVDGAMKLVRHCADPKADGATYYPSGEEGGPGSQTLLAMLYLEGAFGVPVDVDQGVKWLDRAAHQHLGVAEKHLAILYEQGKGVPKDAAKAQYWRDQAAQDADKGPGYWMAL